MIKKILENKFFVLTILLAIVFANYFGVLQNEFVQWDDDVHIFGNPSVRSLDSEHLSDIFTETVNFIYIPLTTFTFALEYHFFGFDPFVYHLNNLLLHLLTVICVYYFALGLGIRPLGAFFVTLLFGIHPIHVESVAWATERKDVLYGFFYMTALLAYLKYLKQDFFYSSREEIKQKNIPPVQYRYLILTVVLGVLSMLAKPMALSLPIILVLIDWFKRRRGWISALIEKIPLGILVAAITWKTYSAHARVPGENVIEGLFIWPWTLSFYLRQMVLPLFSVPIYRLPKPIEPLGWEYGSPILLLILIIFSLWYFRKYRWYLFSFGFFFLSIFFLLRFDDLKDINVVADRFLYLPSLGFCLLGGVIIDYIYHNVKRKDIKIAFGTCVLVVLTFFSVKTIQLNKVWKDSISLWNHQLKYFPTEHIALNNLATVLELHDEYQQAISDYADIMQLQAQGYSINYSADLIESVRRVNHLVDLYQTAIRSDPKFIEAYYGLASILGQIGRYRDAIFYYEVVSTIDDKHRDTFYNLGNIYLKLGQIEDAIKAFDENLRIHSERDDAYINVITAYNNALINDPDNQIYIAERQKAIIKLAQFINRQKKPRASTVFKLANAYAEIGDFDRAIATYLVVLNIIPNHKEALYNLANTYKDIGDLNKAVTYYNKAIKVYGRNSNAFLNLGIVYGRLGNLQEAEKNYKKAIEVDKNNSKAYFSLGYLSEQKGELNMAMDYYNKAIEIDGKNAESYYNLGNLYAKLNKRKKAKDNYLTAVKLNSKHMDAWINLSILSFHEKAFSDAVKYCDEAILLGYDAPVGYLNALEPYR